MLTDPITLSRRNGTESVLACYVAKVRTHGLRYEMSYFNVRSKANMSQLNLPHGTDN